MRSDRARKDGWESWELACVRVIIWTKNATRGFLCVLDLIAEYQTWMTRPFRVRCEDGRSKTLWRFSELDCREVDCNL